MQLSGPPGKTTEPPFLRVSKPVTACSRCRRSKKKCDGKLPVCSACRKAGRANECSRDNDKVIKGSERNYVASLESRVEELEKKLAFARSRKDSLITANSADEPIEPSDCPSSFCAILTAVRGKAARRREAAELEELVSDFGFLSVNATTQDFETATTSMTFARLVLAATRNKPPTEYQPFRIPAKTITMGLINHYMKNIFPLFPIFSEAELFSVLDTIYQERGPPITEFEYWLFCMVLAISSTNQSKCKNDKYYVEGATWIGRALHFADTALVPGYVSQIQALVLLVQYSMLDPSYFDSWNLIGFACRAVVDLGFHQDPLKEEEVDPETLKLRRTIFYCVYSLDRTISMVHARPFSFTDDSINVSLPSLEPQLFSKMPDSPSLAEPKNLYIAVKLFKFRIIQSSWYQKTFQSDQDPYQNSSTYIWQVCRDMQSWANSCQKNLPDPFRELFDLELFYSYVYLFTPPSNLKATSACEKKFIFEYSIKYIQKISSSLVDPAYGVLYNYHDALRVFFVGSQFLSILAENQDHFLNFFSLSPSLEEFLPPLSSNLQTDNIDRISMFITQIKEILTIFGCRWEDAKVLLSSLEPQLEKINKTLNIRKGIPRSSLH
ncbi:hypothetical protein K3495_g7905 [Podosphaera aphanis]|nr:hypothetical protein K3495_g7905 [Podosphaera aphanis]